MKRFFDIFLSLALIVLFAPLYLLTGLLILWKMGRPLLFSQERPGYKGKIFTIYKFRTMTNEKDSNGNLLPDAQRLHGVGRFIRSTSLDELPQLFNVLKGEMSFVGPRPLLVEYLELYNDEQKKRHDVKPGITGWAQVNGRNAISWEQKFAYDVWYVAHRSFWLDMKILWLTFLKVFQRSGINSDTHATTEKFKGTKKMSTHRFENWQYPQIEEGKPTKYNWVVQNKEGLELGFATDIGAFTYINAKHGVVIEEGVQIGSHCSIYSVSTIDEKKGKVVLKKNAKIGSHTTVLPNVTIGENSIVGAHSLVLGDIPDNVVAFGVPAKVVRGLHE